MVTLNEPFELTTRASEKSSVVTRLEDSPLVTVTDDQWRLNGPSALVTLTTHHWSVRCQAVPAWHQCQLSQGFEV